MNYTNRGNMISDSEMIYPRRGSRVFGNTTTEASSKALPNGSLRIVHKRVLLPYHKTRVYVDNTLLGIIKDGQSVTALLEEGEHTISLKIRRGGRHIFPMFREIEQKITIKSNTETTVRFRPTSFDRNMLVIKSITEAPWPNYNNHKNKMP